MEINVQNPQLNGDPWAESINIQWSTKRETHWLIKTLHFKWTYASNEITNLVKWNHKRHQRKTHQIKGNLIKWKLKNKPSHTSFKYRFGWVQGVFALCIPPSANSWWRHIDEPISCMRGDFIFSRKGGGSYLYPLKAGGWWWIHPKLITRIFIHSDQINHKCVLGTSWMIINKYCDNNLRKWFFIILNFLWSIARKLKKLRNPDSWNLHSSIIIRNQGQRRGLEVSWKMMLKWRKFYNAL